MSSRTSSLLHRRRASQPSELSISAPKFVRKGDLAIVTKKKVQSLEELPSTGSPGLCSMPGVTHDITIPPNNMIIIRDTLEVLKKIAKEFEEEMPDVDFQRPVMSKIVSADFLEVSKRFDEWLDQSKKAVESLKSLDLSDLGLKSLPKSLNKLTALTYLDLRKNSFETVSPNIATMISLTNLDLSKNKIKNLPSWIGNLKNLDILNLSYNELTTLPEEIKGLENLTQIDLWDNKFKKGPEVLYEMKKEYGNDKKLDVCMMSEDQSGPWPIKSMEKELEEVIAPSTTKRKPVMEIPVKAIKDRSFCSPSFQDLAIGIIMSIGLLALSIACARNLNNIAVLD